MYIRFWEYTLYSELLKEVVMKAVNALILVRSNGVKTMLEKIFGVRIVLW